MRNLILAAALGAAVVGVSSTSSSAAIAYALTDGNSLVSFDTASPNVLLGASPLLHTAANASIEDLIGIDFRPSNSTMYGVGRLGTIYTINPITGVATPGASLSVALSGSRFGFDFNPVADRLRITSDTKQDLRIDVSTGATTVDTALNPGNPNVTSSAYTNNFAGVTAAIGTTLYDIDSVTDTLYIQNPPNNGTLVAVGTGGGLGIDISSLSGFDIQTIGGGTPNAVQNAFAVLQLASDGVSKLYSINLTAGTASLVGTVGGGDLYDGFTIAIPEPTTLGVLGGMAAMMMRRRSR